MGYEIKLYVGKPCLEGDEHARDMDQPYCDGSGYHYKKDEKGNFVPTGRREKYFMVMAMIDLCKLGYQDDALNKLIAQSFEMGKTNKDKLFHYFYDGNEQVTEDCYGATFWPVPVRYVLDAMKTVQDKDDPYRRLTWAIALLEAMKDDSEQLEVLFYGH